MPITTRISKLFATLVTFTLTLLGTWNPTMGQLSTATESATKPNSLWVYVAGEGVRLYQMDLSTGGLSLLSETQAAHPSFLALHPNGQFLYGGGNEISAFSIDPANGNLTLLNQIPYEENRVCHLVVDRLGANVLSASYGSGSVSVHRLEPDGQLGKRSSWIQHVGSSVVESRQQGPHAHSINLDADNQFAIAADLGIDKMLIYQFNATEGTLEKAEPGAVCLKPGAGPRHFVFHPTGKFGYVINELDSTVTAFRYDSALGQLQEIETVTTLPSDFTGENSPAEIAIEPQGRYLYGSNRGHDSLVVYAIDPDQGKLTVIQHISTGGHWPRNFCITPNGKYLLAANQKSNQVVVFRIHPQSGKLTPTEHSVRVPGPSCVRFLEP